MAEITAKFVSAYEAADVKSLVALLTDDVFMSMPPMPLEYIGRDAVETFFAPFFAARRNYKLVRTSANGQPAFAVYERSADGRWEAHSIQVLALHDDEIATLTIFTPPVGPGLFEAFGLPYALADERASHA